MALKLDNWKDLNQIGSAEKVHRQNEQVREQGKSLDNKLRQAYENYRTKGKTHLKTSSPSSSPAEKGIGKGEGVLSQPKGPTSSSQTDVAKTPTQSTEATRVGSELAKKVETKVNPQPTVYRSATATSSGVANTPQARAASQFVIGTNNPSLANLVLKGNTPPTPPSAKDAKQTQPSHLSDVIQQAQQGVAPKVQAPIASDAGGKLADATHRQADSEVGKKKGEKRSESGDRAEGKGGGLATSRSRASGEGGRLEAASSGVASDSGEPVWIADLAPIGYTVNPASTLDNNRDEVRERAEKFRKYVEQPKFAEVMARGVKISQALDELFDQVKKNIPPKNSYGVVRG